MRSNFNRHICIYYTLNVSAYYAYYISGGKEVCVYWMPVSINVRYGQAYYSVCVM